MAAVGCRKSAIFGRGLNPWGYGNPQNLKMHKKYAKKSSTGSKIRTSVYRMTGEKHAIGLSRQYIM